MALRINPFSTLQILRTSRVVRMELKNWIFVAACPDNRFAKISKANHINNSKLQTNKVLTTGFVH